MMKKYILPFLLILMSVIVSFSALSLMVRNLNQYSKALMEVF
ncbi:hypothetical protein ArsFIN_18730 [Arsenophonus nasoniae]|uniref:Uncharacterized protein n=1 Tax=Arsenophonus nasoniae TaxID=638 RepID=A0A4P7KU09_9GAMM|nr:hypothetical protein ArsFIN_18730 [Arsenophonus nasoniae]